MTVFLRVLSLGLALSLGGCVIGDGVAHMVKLIDKKANGGGDSATQPAPAPTKPDSVPVDRDQPPAVQAAPRDEIKVETLPPQAD